MFFLSESFKFYLKTILIFSGLIWKTFSIIESTIEDTSRELNIVHSDMVSCLTHSILDYQTFYSQTDRFLQNLPTKYKIQPVNLKDCYQIFQMNSLKHLIMSSMLPGGTNTQPTSRQ